MKAYYQPFIETLRSAGATLVDVTFTPDYGKLGDDRTNVLLYEFKADLNNTSPPADRSTNRSWN